MKLHARLVRKDEQEKRILEIPRKRIEGFHLTWVEIRTLAVRDVVETVDVVVMAEEVAVEVPVRPCLDQRLVPAKI